MTIMQFAQQILRQRGIEVREEILQKDDASIPMPTALLASLSEEPGLVLCGISD